MGILIEVTTGDTSPKEWDALAAFVATMQGKSALIAAPTKQGSPDRAKDAAAPSVSIGVGDASDDEQEGPVVELPEAGLTPLVIPEGVDVDVRGLPWDGRIHASTKTKVKSGEWTAKRNADPEMVKAVEAELFKAMAAPTPAPTPAIQVEGAPPAPPPPAAASAIAVEGSPAAAPPPPGAEAGETVFAAFMRRVVAKQSSGVLTTTMTNEIAASLGLTSVRDLSARPDLIPAFEALLP